MTIRLQEGTNVFAKLGHTIEPYLRRLGVDTKLVDGKIKLLSDQGLCTMGEKLTAEQCRVLKLIKVKVAKFRIKMVSVWKNDGSFKLLD